MSSLSTKETYHLSVLGVMVGVGSTRKVGGGRSQPQEVMLWLRESTSRGEKDLASAIL